jgi:hypothetical protein
MSETHRFQRFTPALRQQAFAPKLKGACKEAKLEKAARSEDAGSAFADTGEAADRREHTEESEKGALASSCLD